MVVGPDLGFFVCLLSIIWAVSLTSIVWMGSRGAYQEMVGSMLILLGASLNYCLVAFMNPGLPSLSRTRE